MAAGSLTILGGRKILLLIQKRTKMKVINLFGPPGVGKSVISAAVYADLAKNNLNVELVQEYAKQLVWEQRTSILTSDQLYILAKQHRRLSTLKDKNLDYVVLDSPLFLQTVYNNSEVIPKEIFEPLVLNLISKYENINFLLERTKEYEYKKIGRLQDLDESNEIGGRIKEKLDQYNIPYFPLKSNNRTVGKIVSKIFELRMNT